MASIIQDQQWYALGFPDIVEIATVLSLNFRQDDFEHLNSNVYALDLILNHQKP